MSELRWFTSDLDKVFLEGEVIRTDAGSLADVGSLIDDPESEGEDADEDDETEKRALGGAGAEFDFPSVKPQLKQRLMNCAIFIPACWRYLS